MTFWPQKSSEVTGGHRRSKEVKRRSNLKNALIDPFFFNTYPYDILDLHRLYHCEPKTDNRSTEVTGGQNEVKFEKCTLGSNLLQTYSYDIPDQHKLWQIAPEVIRVHMRSLEVTWGHWRSLKVTGGHWWSQEIKFEKCTQSPYFGMHTHVISLTNTSFGILTIKFIKGHWKSLEVTGGHK